LSLFASFNPFFSDSYNKIQVDQQKGEEIIKTPMLFENKSNKDDSKKSNKVQKVYKQLDTDIDPSYIGYLKVKAKSYALLVYKDNRYVIKESDNITLEKIQLFVSSIDEKRVILSSSNGSKKIVYFTYKKR
jgi:hypothetical protein